MSAWSRRVGTWTAPTIARRPESVAKLARQVPRVLSHAQTLHALQTRGWSLARFSDLELRMANPEGNAELAKTRPPLDARARWGAASPAGSQKLADFGIESRGAYATLLNCMIRCPRRSWGVCEQIETVLSQMVGVVGMFEKHSTKTTAK